LIQVFNHDFVIYIDFTNVAALNTASDEVTNYFTRGIFNTNLQHNYAHFIFKVDDKCSRNGGF